MIAYPTEAVYGLGCDPFNQKAVERLVALKQRSLDKGLILLISDWSQWGRLVGYVPTDRLDAVRATWPGPVTWLFPKAATIPYWLNGEHDTIALRMTAHPIARQLCAEGPVISTSANRSGHLPAVDLTGVQKQFPQGIDAFLEGALGGAQQTSAIYDVMTGQRMR